MDKSRSFKIDLHTFLCHDVALSTATLKALILQHIVLTHCSEMARNLKRVYFGHGNLP